MKFNELEIYINNNFEIVIIQDGIGVCITQDQAELVADELKNLKFEAKRLEAEDE